MGVLTLQPRHRRDSIEADGIRCAATALHCREKAQGDSPLISCPPWGKTKRIQKELRCIPSGYVKIAIENGHL